MRYQGQNYEQEVPFPEAELGEAALQAAYDRYGQFYEDFYGYRLDGIPIELVRLSVVAMGEPPVFAGLPSEDTEGIPGNQFIFEPNPGAVLEQLLPRYIAARLFQAVLESKASEESSRMVAMRNATDNAEDLIQDYTLAYNKVRQANITREMIEIASGAQAR